MRILTMLLALAVALPAQGLSLRFFGNGVNDIDRVKIQIDDPTNSLPGPPADVGATDFTIELWLRGTQAENPAGAVSCGANINWIYGNILLDRDRYNQDRKFGVSLAGGRVVFGISGSGTGDRTICGSTNVLDGNWHHLAVQRRRSDGWLSVWLDGRLEAQGDGPDGDVSYPDNGIPGNWCGGPCVKSDPYLVIGAEKHDAGSAYPSFAGRVDELRLSNTLRYSATFPPPTGPFVADAATAALYHFDAGQGTTIADDLGQSPGVRNLGGSPAGPAWSTDSPFIPSCAWSLLGPDPRVPASLTIPVAAPCDAGQNYLAGVALGWSAGIPIDTRVIPLNPDPLLLVCHAVPSVFGGFLGVLDAQGNANATIQLVPPLQGATFYFAFVTLRATAPSGISAISGPLPLVVQ